MHPPIFETDIIAMKRNILNIAFLLCVTAIHAQVDDYLPFVQKGKIWHVEALTLGGTYFYMPRISEYWFGSDEVARDGKSYFILYNTTEGYTQTVGLYREEDRRVFTFREEQGCEQMVYDFTLREGDEFQLNSHACRVKKVGMLDVNGHKLRSIAFDEVIDHEHGDTLYCEWIESIGTPTVFSWDATMVSSYFNYVTYVLADNGLLFLPLPFYAVYNGWRGQQLIVTEAPVDASMEGHLEYEFVFDPFIDNYQLHVWGTMLTPDGPNNYIYCIEDTKTRRVKFRIEELTPRSASKSLHEVNLWFPFFMAGMSYTIVDDSGEHTIICGLNEVTRGFRNHPTHTFDLSGRRLSASPAKGIYIENGQKKLRIR